MKEEDDSDFPPGLQFQEKERELNGDGIEDKEVIAGEWYVRIPDVGGKDADEKEGSEEACPGLLEAEPDELVEGGAFPGEG